MTTAKKPWSEAGAKPPPAAGGVRYCICGKKLSRYNADMYCYACWDRGTTAVTAAVAAKRDWQSETLELLAREEPVTMRRLASLAGVEAPTMKWRLAALRSGGKVECKRVKEDGRTVFCWRIVAGREGYGVDA